MASTAVDRGMAASVRRRGHAPAGSDALRLPQSSATTNGHAAPVAAPAKHQQQQPNLVTELSDVSADQSPAPAPSTPSTAGVASFWRVRLFVFLVTTSYALSFSLSNLLMPFLAQRVVDRMPEDALLANLPLMTPAVLYALLMAGYSISKGPMSPWVGLLADRINIGGLLSCNLLGLGLSMLVVGCHAGYTSLLLARMACGVFGFSGMLITTWMPRLAPRNQQVQLFSDMAVAWALARVCAAALAGSVPDGDAAVRPLCAAAGISVGLASVLVASNTEWTFDDADSDASARLAGKVQSWTPAAGASSPRSLLARPPLRPNGHHAPSPHSDPAPTSPLPRPSLVSRILAPLQDRTLAWLYVLIILRPQIDFGPLLLSRQQGMADLGRLSSMNSLAATLLALAGVPTWLARRLGEQRAAAVTIFGMAAAIVCIPLADTRLFSVAVVVRATCESIHSASFAAFVNNRARTGSHGVHLGMRHTINSIASLTGTFSWSLLSSAGIALPFYANGLACAVFAIFLLPTVSPT